MGFRYLAIGMMGLSCAIAVSSAVSLYAPSRLHAKASPGASHLHAYGSRSAAQKQSAVAGKFDAALAELARHAAQASTSRPIADLHSMSPAAKFKLSSDGVTPLVSIDAVTRGDVQQLKTALESLGLQKAAVFSNDVGGWLPVSQLEAAAALNEVHSMRAAMSRTRAGAVTSQGDFVQQSAALRTADGLTGSGVTVGVLSDSFNCYAVYAESGSGVPASGYAGYAFNGYTATYADDVSSGDLPSGVNVLEEADCLQYGAPIQPPFGDEGRAMLQIVHDVAPSASLAFYTAEDNEADFAAGIGKLASAGATVIADDVGYFDEPFFQDGLVAQAVDSVEAAGVAYFSAAGNEGNASYENTAPSFGTLSSSGSNSGEYLLNFDTTGATTTTTLPITLDAMEPGEFAAIVLEWDQPFVTGAANSGGATSRIDMCVTGATNEYTIEDYDGDTVTCTGANAAGSDPVQVLIIANPADASSATPPEKLNLVIGLADGTKAPDRIKVVVETDGQTDAPITTFATNSPTIQGHPGAAGAMAIGAAFYFDTPACGTTPATLEAYSSLGGDPILFQVDTTAGTALRLTTPVTRQKPNVVGPDGVNDTFLGYSLYDATLTGSNNQLSTSIASCQNDGNYPNFFGTSAATPHVAGIAALMLQANSALTPTQIYDSLQTSAVGMGTVPNYSAGYGFVQAQSAIALLPPGAPTFTASSTAVSPSSPVTLTWQSYNTTGCTAGGTWSGSLAASGTQSVTPGAVGSYTYTLTCTNAVGTSSASSVTLTVAAATSNTSSSGGGGSSTWFLLLGLAGVGLARSAREILRSRDLI